MFSRDLKFKYRALKGSNLRSLSEHLSWVAWRDCKRVVLESKSLNIAAQYQDLGLESNPVLISSLLCTRPIIRQEPKIRRPGVNWAATSDFAITTILRNASIIFQIASQTSLFSSNAEAWRRCFVNDHGKEVEVTRTATSNNFESLASRYLEDPLYSINRK